MLATNVPAALQQVGFTVREATPETEGMARFFAVKRQKT